MTREIVVAAVQPRLAAGQVEANLERLEDLTRSAHHDFGPDVIVLPDSMTSPISAYSDADNVPRHIDGAPLNLLRQLAKDLRCVVTGGAMSVRGHHAFQTYMLVEPDGATYLHNRTILGVHEERLCRAGDGASVYTTSTFGDQSIGVLAGPEWASQERAAALHEGRAGLVVGGLFFPSDIRGRIGRRAGDRNGGRETSIQMARYLGVTTVMACHAHTGADSRICGPDGTVLAELAKVEGVIAATVPIGRSRVEPLTSAVWKNGPMRPRGLRRRSEILVGSAAYWSRWIQRDFPWQDSAHSDLPDVVRPQAQQHARPLQSKPTHNDQLLLTVIERELVAKDVVRLKLKASSGAPLPPWGPGAHIDLILDDSLVRQYSLCGNPNDPFYEIAVLREHEGRGGSALVHETLKVGEQVRASLPRNHFELEDAEQYVFIAGGIGITPIRAMMRVAHSRGRKFELFYGGRSDDTMAFGSELAEQYPGDVHVRAQDRDGLLDLEECLKNALDGTMVYCCGPEPLLRAVEAECRNHPEVHLRVERFVAAPRGDGTDAPVEVTVGSTGRVIQVPAGVSILSALRDAELDIDYSCQTGVCGSCEVAVLEGLPDHRDSILAQLQPTDRMMPCVSRARTPSLTLDI
ncbi:nitrilase-related carbon-nitrogen hydrolase [Nocardia sp. NPDC059246]|uniref:nitrilase-related carbon-nitrogen hydrolase n=1 Tax=unclassified Nocardia TaxID=2637762 RepID=UPI0036A45CFD